MDHILSKPVGDFELEDHMAWKFDRKGFYSVRTGYHITDSDNLASFPVPRSLS